MFTLQPARLILATAILAAALALVTETIRHSRRDIAPRPLSSSRSALGPATRYDQTRTLFTLSAIPHLNSRTNQPHPFYTTHFQPASPPRKATRQVELTYQGFLQTADGARQAYIRVGTNLVVGPIGTRVAGNLSVGAIERPAVTLVNGETQALVLAFRARTNAEVTLE